MVESGARGNHQKVKPGSIVDYNKFKCGVDRHDQMLSYHAFQRRSIKWWKKLFFHLLDICVVSTQVLYNLSRENEKDKVKIDCVYKVLAEAFAKESTAEELVIQNDLLLVDNNRVIPSKHFPRSNLSKIGAKRERIPQRQCVVCKINGKRRDSSYSCRSCKVSLCISRCFEVYHRRHNLQEGSVSDDE